MKLVSILIPAYNHEKYIQETIKSIINQTYKNIELIIIDDGSTDSTWNKIQEIKNECESRFVNIHFETQDNKGTCDTLNKLISLANGDYIYIIASDDIAKTQAIEKEVKFLSKNPAYGLVVGDDEIIDADSKVCYWDKDRNNVYDKTQAVYKTFADFLKNIRRDINFNSKQFGTYNSLYCGNYIPNGYLIKKEVFNDIRFVKDAPLEDYYLMLQISKKYKMKYLDEVLYSYRWHSANTIKQETKILEYDRKTRDFEEKILANIDKNDVYLDVIYTREYGNIYKKQGIPYIFEIVSYRKNSLKTKFIKLFNIPIFKFSK
ncbi:MAG: glycosyltransferase family 2 protein [Candidatus Gastranaerophilaceae bacterium]